MKFFTSALLALAALPSVFGANQQLPDGILGIKMDKADPKGVPGVKAGMTFSSKVIFKDDVWNTLLDGAKRDAQLVCFSPSERKVSTLRVLICTVPILGGPSPECLLANDKGGGLPWRR